MKKICEWCKIEIKDNEEFNQIAEALTHKKCDEDYFERQEQKVKYIRRWDKIH